MATKKAASKKEADNPIKTLRQEIEALKNERLEVLQQLRMGTNPNVRKPTLIRRQIARALTRLRQLETAAQDSKLSTATKEGA